MRIARRQLIPMMVALAVVGAMALAIRLKPAVFHETQPSETIEGPAQSVLADDGRAGLSVSAPASVANAAVAAQDPVTTRKLQLLDQILVSKNDNDPRLDHELKGLSRETKSALRAKYDTLSAEDRNGRGTIVFLIGREATVPADVDFLRRVLSEAPCLSLADCSKDGATNATEELHHEGVTEITLAYPQLVALSSIEAALISPISASIDDATREAGFRAIDAAKNSGNPVVARKASELEERLERPRAGRVSARYLAKGL